jgi:hypothetical protein
MRILLLTDGAGFIGSHHVVAENALARGHEEVAAVNGLWSGKGENVLQERPVPTRGTCRAGAPGFSSRSLSPRRFVTAGQELPHRLLAACYPERFSVVPVEVGKVRTWEERR